MSTEPDADEIDACRQAAFDAWLAIPENVDRWNAAIEKARKELYG